MARVLAIAFPDILIEQAKAQKTRTHGFDRPWVVVLRKEGSQRKAPSSYSRISAASGAARKLGIAPGQTLASARAKASSLGVTILTEAHLKAELIRIAELSMVFAPYVAFEPEQSLVWVQINDSAHLHRQASDSSGERTLATRLGALFAPTRHRFRMAVADGPRLAAATVLHSQDDQAIQIALPGKLSLIHI